MNKRTFFSRFLDSLGSCCALVLLVTLAWSNLAVCAEIHDAVEKGGWAKVKALVKKNPDLVFSTDAAGQTPLHVAATVGNMDIAKLLLENKADVNARDNDGETPLHDAVDGGNSDVVKLLLANKADVNAKDNAGKTPLLLAATGHEKQDFSDTGWRFHANLVGANESVVKLLLAGKAGVNARDKAGDTPLHDAADGGYTDVVKLLLAHNADINAKNTNGDTPLHLAVSEVRKKVVKLLLDRKADVNARNNQGETPLHNAIFNGDDDMEELLRQHGGHE